MDILSVSSDKDDGQDVRPTNKKDDGQDVRPTGQDTRATKSLAASPLMIIAVPVQKLIAETFDSELLGLMGV